MINKQILHNLIPRQPPRFSDRSCVNELVVVFDSRNLIQSHGTHNLNAVGAIASAKISQGVRKKTSRDEIQKVDTKENSPKLSSTLLISWANGPRKVRTNSFPSILIHPHQSKTTFPEHILTSS